MAWWSEPIAPGFSSQPVKIPVLVKLPNGQLCHGTATGKPRQVWLHQQLSGFPVCRAGRKHPGRALQLMSAAPTDTGLQFQTLAFGRAEEAEKNL